MKKKLLVIVPCGEIMHDSPFYLLDSDTGECLASHYCSNYSFAYSDLYLNREDMVEELDERFGEFDVKYLHETNIPESVMIERNKKYYETHH